jgi:hypothetical protein
MRIKRRFADHSEFIGSRLNKQKSPLLKKYARIFTSGLFTRDRCDELLNPINDF